MGEGGTFGDSKLWARALTAVVLDERGALVTATSLGKERWARDAPWATAARTLVRAFVDGAKASAVKSAFEFAVEELHGERGERTYLVSEERAEPRIVGAASTVDLSSRQRTVAEYAAAGATLNEIAIQLGLQRETVKTHLRAVYGKLRVSNRAELVRAWSRMENGASDARLTTS